MSKQSQSGFTLVELAISLVIIGLVLGMTFKGRELIDGAKVKSVQAQYGKVSAALNIFFERYGRYPGDGCPSNDTTAFTACTNTPDGILSTTAEQTSFWSLLNTSNTLPLSEKKNSIGDAWQVISGDGINAAMPAVFPPTWTFLYSPAVDSRMLCQLERQIDDMNPSTGIIRSDSTVYSSATQDCWALTPQPSKIALKLLP